ncbi:MAG: hypothetical protein RL317_1163 [Pseudomonadota bacterium]
MMRKILFPFSAAFLLVSAPVLPALAAPKPAPHKPAAAHPALWKVADADTTIYLFGTVHILKPGTRWFEGPIRTAFAASDELVLEMVEPAPAEANRLVMSKAVDPDGPALTAKLSPADVEPYRAALRSFGLEAANLEPLEPWFVSTLLALLPLQKLGYDAEQGVEKGLSREAKSIGKPISGLETMEEQLSFFDSLPEPAQIKLLTQSVQDLPKAEQFAQDMTRYWLSGQPDELAKLMNKSMDSTPELNKILLVDRNRRWAEWIAKRLDKPGTVFLAVGAAHLAGEDSVQAQLRTHKLKAARLN